MTAPCPQCGSPMARSHRRGLVERVMLAPMPFVRPFLCARCGFRGLRLTKALDIKDVILFLISMAVGLLLLNVVWLVRTRAPGHPGGGYEPKDLERQRYLEQEKKQR